MMDYKRHYNPLNIFARAVGLNMSHDRKLGNICECSEKYLKDNKHNSLHMTWKNLLTYLSSDITCSEKGTVFRKRSIEDIFIIREKFIIKLFIYRQKSSEFFTSEKLDLKTGHKVF